MKLPEFRTALVASGMQITRDCRNWLICQRKTALVRFAKAAGTAELTLYEYSDTQKPKAQTFRNLKAEAVLQYLNGSTAPPAPEITIPNEPVTEILHLLQ